MGITADEAWPERVVASRAFTPDEIARACVALAACSDVGRDRHGLFDDEAGMRAQLQDDCLSGWARFYSTAERAIPFGGYRSWHHVVQSTLDAGSDCARIRTLLPPDEGSFFMCQEDGCYAEQKTSVRCVGKFAIVETSSGTVTRDCSLADTKCSESSPTGCTDRQLTRCDGGGDRCDGDVRLGCDGCGFVSYRDCSWNGGRCVETEDGASCTSPEGAAWPGPWDPGACAEMPKGCQGNTLSVCVANQQIDVDCAAIGMGTCVPNLVTHSIVWTVLRTHAHCVPLAADAGVPEAAVVADGGF